MPTAQVVVYAAAGIQVDVIAGAPPVDQSAQVAALTQQVGTLQTANTKLQGKLDALALKAQQRVDADAAKVDGADELAIING